MITVAPREVIFHIEREGVGTAHLITDFEDLFFVVSDSALGREQQSSIYAILGGKR